MKYMNTSAVQNVFAGLRPAVVGLLAAAALLLMTEENFSSPSSTHGSLALASFSSPPFAGTKFLKIHTYDRLCCRCRGTIAVLGKMKGEKRKNWKVVRWRVKRWKNENVKGWKDGEVANANKAFGLTPLPCSKIKRMKKELTCRKRIWRLIKMQNNRGGEESLMPILHQEAYSSEID